LVPDVIRLLDDESALVRGAAVWALARLVSRERVAALAATHSVAEIDLAVKDEWTHALADAV
jgi:epoxyqueuosine reductase